MVVRLSPDITPAWLAGHRLSALNAEVKFGYIANGRSSHEVIDNTGVSGLKTKTDQKLISFK
jgi:hypothetical protein